jgi:20S proteasome alpha/beta subunit
MTTIVFKNGILVADTRTTYGNVVSPEIAKKLFRLKNGTVCAMSGGYMAGVTYIKWLNGEILEKPPLEETTVLHMTKDGLYIHEGEGFAKYEHEYGAWGSGSPAALGALELGADAETACRIACKFDMYSSEPIVVMECEDQEDQEESEKLVLNISSKKSAKKSLKALKKMLKEKEK